ncbi:MAG: hypothetical protein Ta2A_26500 [Treponemataceae bacterium]|nr:MAG: hypothetical protein Ta2A_26500 [Treponemataceae bacterium]
MRISSKGKYSLQAMLYLSLLQNGEMASTRTIARATGISERYLEQLFIPLRKAGVVSGVRGARGGYFLSLPPSEISAGLILRVSEGTFVASAAHTWNDLYFQMDDCLNSITLGDISAQFCALSPGPSGENAFSGEYSAGDYAI